MVEETAQLCPLWGSCQESALQSFPSARPHLFVWDTWAWALGCPPPRPSHQRALRLSPSTEAVRSTEGVPRPPLRSGPVPLTTEREDTQQNPVGNEIYWKLLSHIQYWFGGYIRRRLHNMRQVEGLGGGCGHVCAVCLCWAPVQSGKWVCARVCMRVSLCVCVNKINESGKEMYFYPTAHCQKS